MADEQTMEIAQQRIPIHRIGQPRDVGDGVAFLTSDAAGYITGVTLPITGGDGIKSG